MTPGFPSQTDRRLHVAEPAPRSGDGTMEVGAGVSPRRLRNRLLQLGGVGAVIVSLVLFVPGFSDIRERLEDADPAWLALAGVLQLGSVLSYVVIFRGVFSPRMPLRMSYRIGVAEQAANSLVPAGGAGGLALGAWALRRLGIPGAQIGRRSVAFFLLTSAASVWALIAFGPVLALGGFSPRSSRPFTLAAVAVACLAVACVVAVALLASPNTDTGRATQPDSLSQGAQRFVKSAAVAGGSGARDALDLLAARDPQVIAGSLGYLGFSIAALGASFAAFGAVPPVPLLVVAYVVGMLGALLPIPGGVGGVDGGLIGMFTLYGTPFVGATATILAYRVLALWLPALLGSIAFVRLERSFHDAARLRAARLAVEEVAIEQTGLDGARLRSAA